MEVIELYREPFFGDNGTDKFAMDYMPYTSSRFLIGRSGNKTMLNFLRLTYKDNEGLETHQLVRRPISEWKCNSPIQVTLLTGIVVFIDTNRQLVRAEL